MATTSPPGGALSPSPWAGAPQLDLDLDRAVAALLQRFAGDISAEATRSALRSVRQRLSRLSRRRRLGQSLGTGTLAAGLVAGGAHQALAAWSPGASPSSEAAAPPDAAPTPGVTTPRSTGTGPLPGDGPITGQPAPAPLPLPAPGLGSTSWSWDQQEGVDRLAADPGALYADGAFHVYTTSGNQCVEGGCAFYHVPFFTGADLAHSGRLAGDALPTLPAWVSADEPAVWAPQVASIDGRYVLYFTATSTHDHGGQKCLGAAVAPAPAGPFVPLDQPLWCRPDGWAIDAYPVAAGDDWYLLWRQDDPLHPKGAIVGAPLSPDGLAVVSSPTTLLVGEEPWEDGTGAGIGPIENPAMARDPATGEWLLAWSANNWDTQDYATGLATCDGPLGPCDRAGDPTRPWLRTDGDIDVGKGAAVPRFGGAGGLSFVTGPDSALYAVFHAYAGDGVHPAPRVAWTARVDAEHQLVMAGNHSGPVSVKGA